MKPVERFFRKYFLSMVGIIALFLLLNVVLLFLCADLGLADLGDTGPLHERNL